MIRETKSSMKGQMFMIGSVIIVVVLILVRTGTDVTEILEKKRFLEAGIERVEFDNLRREVIKSAYNGINDTQTMLNETNSFLNFTESKYSARNIQLDGATVISRYVDATGGSDIDVTFFNLFDTNVSTLVLNYTTGTAGFTDIRPGETRDAQFALFSGGGPSENTTLWIYYQVPGEQIVHTMTIGADTSTTRFFNYFDIRTNTDRGDIRDRFSETIEIN